MGTAPDDEEEEVETNDRAAKNTAFRAWLKELDKLCVAKFGLTLSCLPDMLTRDAFDAGTSPQEFFDEDVMRTMREDYGSLVDEL